MRSAPHCGHFSATAFDSPGDSISVHRLSCDDYRVFQVSLQPPFESNGIHDPSASLTTIQKNIHSDGAASRFSEAALAR